MEKNSCSNLSNSIFRQFKEKYLNQLYTNMSYSNQYLIETCLFFVIFSIKFLRLILNLQSGNIVY